MPTIEIFRAGKRADANGNVVEITAADLEKVAKNYNPKTHEAPIVVGHPKTDAPAYGWVSKLQLEGDVLKAHVDKLEPEFAELVRQGRYKKISSAFYLPNSDVNPQKDGFYLRHVGFLGAAAPAVKGLKDPVFSDSTKDWCTFEEETVVTTPSVEVVKQEPVPTTENKNYQPQGETMSQTEKEELEKLRGEVSALKAEKAAAAKAAAEKANAEFAEALITEGKILPKNKEEILNLLNTDTATAEFSECNFKDRLKAFLKGLPQCVEFKETATAAKAETAKDVSLEYAEGTDPASIAMDQKVKAYMEANKVTYNEAFNIVAYQ